MDPEIYKQLGELQGRFNTFEQNMAKEFSDLKETIRSQSIVPYDVYAARVKATDLIHESHEKRLESLENSVGDISLSGKLRKNSVSGRLAEFFDGAVVKIIGASVVSLVVIAVYWQYQSQIEALNEKINRVEEVDIVVPPQPE